MGSRYYGRQEEQRGLDAFVKLMRAAESVSARAHRTLSGNGLTVSQFGVLEALHHLGPLCQKELAAKLLRSNGNLTTVVGNLERRGLVARARDTRDRRYVQVDLTQAGQELISGLFPAHARRIAGEMSVLSDQELASLARLCKKLGRAAATDAVSTAGGDVP